MTTNSSVNFFSGQNSNHLSIYKGRRSPIAAFILLIFALLFLGCESQGIVGDDIIPNDDLINSKVDLVDNLSVINENTFSGRLANTSLGYVEDPLYGSIKSVALLKPSISNTQVDTIHTGDKIFLKLIFDSQIYGNENAVSDFEVYEAGEIWRGNQLRYNQHEIAVNFSDKVADFQVADEDTVWVELSQNWVAKFAEHFNNESADRDSLYRNTFPGLAIVPSESNQKIRFLRNLRDESDELLTSFFVESEFHEDDEENGDEENGGNEENGMQELGVRDWGASFVRMNSTEITDAIVLHNTESTLRVELDLPVEELKTKNISNAQLVLTLNQESENQYPNFVRPQTNLLTTYVFNEKPKDLAAEIFITDPADSRDFTILQEDEDTFRINITQYVLNEVFGDTDGRELYIAIQTTNGILYSSQFYDYNGPDNKKPRIVITSVN